MSRNVLIITKFVLIIIFIFPCAYAEVPREINYQGRLLRASGNPVSDGSYSLVFGIFNAENAGNLIWEETHPTVDVNDGLFSVDLGTIDPAGNPLDLDIFGESDRWLEISVDGTILLPRTKFTSVPYAYMAKSGGGWVDDGSSVRLQTSSDFVGIGTTSPARRLHIQGSGSAGESEFQITDTDSDPDVNWYVGARNDYFHIVESGVQPALTILKTSGNVGIGTIAPAEKLEVDGIVYSTSGGFKFPDGSIQTTSASTGGIAIITGSAAHNSLITPPAGYTVSQCHCIVSSRAFGPMGNSSEGYSHWCYVTEESGGWRVYAKSRNTVYGSYLDDTANYMVIGLK